MITMGRHERGERSRVVVITGASAGVGRALARAYAKILRECDL
jgi:NAD(P)-dependent dehydrogenase (short-subunit alcohol dehydrogenase family)